MNLTNSNSAGTSSTSGTMVLRSDLTRPLTFGERLVGVTFNVSKNPKVDEIKRYFANLIDDINQRSHMKAQELMEKTVEGYVENGKLNQMDPTDQTEVLISHQAIIQLKQACMWTVNYYVI
jgi:hypothetical protein